jgi:protein SCO1/2
MTRALRATFLWLILWLSLAGILGSFLWNQLHPPAGSARLSGQAPTPKPALQPLGYGAAPAFVLTDQNGQPFDSERLKGSVWIADFIFTSCTGSCPEMSRRMSILQDRLEPEIQLVSISVDPARDTPAALFEYASRYRAQPGRWHFLTGEREAIAQLVQKGFKLSFAEGGSAEEPITHSVRFVLVDREGILRGYYDSTDPKAFEQLIRDARGLARKGKPFPSSDGRRR